MRVLHVVATGQRRGAELFASDLIHALGEDGISQHVVVLRETGGVAVAYQAPIAVLRPKGGVIRSFPMDPGRIRALRAFVGKWEPSVIHAHGGEAFLYSVLGGRGAPIVYKRISLALPHVRRGLYRATYSALIRRAARVVAVADVVRREMITTFRIPPDRVVTIPNGRDARRLQGARAREDVRRELGIAPEAPAILSLGALSWEKDPLVQVDAAARVLADVPDAVHLVAGDGPMREEVEGAVRSHALDGRALVLGSRADAADLLSASDVMLMASRTEGMPGSLIEAGMAGLPVVAYAVGGVSEVVEHGVTGLLVPPGDIEALTDALLQLVKDGAARRAMGRAAQQRCRSNFDIRVVAPRYVQLYREVARAN